jgi:uncharacterized protein with ATP-grasp and redox domains
MIGMKLVGMLIGRKAKEKVVDAVLDKVNLPDPVETAIKVAATGNVGDLLGGMGKDMAQEAVLGAVTKRVKKK